MISFLKSSSNFDRIVWLSIIILTVLIGVILWRGDQSSLRVSYFSWQERKIGVQDRSFTLKFNLPVNQETVEANLVTNPSLPGKISWKRGQLVYTLTDLPIYGKRHELQLERARALLNNQEIESFIGLINTHDRAFVYIGIQGEEQGKLILCKITPTGLEKNILTPADLVVTYFQIYPRGDRLLFSAFDASRGSQGLPQQQLYTVTTGLSFQVSQTPEPLGRIRRVLDAKDYRNIQFALSENGKTIIVQRENHNNPGDAGLWVIPDHENPRPLGIQASQFMVSPDGKRVAISQAAGVQIIPLTEHSVPPQFYPGYEKIVSFSKDGKQILLVRNNPDFTRSLVLINQKGETKNLFDTVNPILSCVFEPREETNLYCLKTDLIQQEDGTITQEPFLSIIDLTDGEYIPFLALPNYQDVQMSMSPDGVALLFDQVVTIPLEINKNLVTRSGQAIADGRLWLLSLPEEINEDTLPSIEELNPGFQPRWVP